MSLKLKMPLLLLHINRSPMFWYKEGNNMFMLEIYASD